MNYKISKETRCKMCGKEIDYKEPEISNFGIATASFDNIMKLSYIRMFDGGEFIECAERADDVFYFHPDCGKALLKINHFDWLNKGMHSE
jgi:hypothetical protein